MSVIKDITRGIAPYAVLAGIGVIAWLNRDKIIGWFRSAIAEPVVSAVSAAGETVSAVANTPIISTGAESWSVGEAALGWNPLTFVATLPAQLMGVAGGIVGNMFTGQHESPAPVSDTFVSAPQPVPTEADILWQAKLAEVEPPPSGPPPSGYQVRGTSLLGAPLYKPVNQMIGTIDLPDGVTGEVWQLGTSKLVKVNGMWFGENISACILKGGTWDFQKARCMYA